MSSKSWMYRNSGHLAAATTKWDRQNFWFLFPLNAESIFFCQKLKLAKPMTAEQLSGFLLKSTKCLSDPDYDRWHFTSLSSPMPFFSPLKTDFNSLHSCFTVGLIQSALSFHRKGGFCSCLHSSFMLSCDHKGSENTCVSIVDHIIQLTCRHIVNISKRE